MECACRRRQEQLGCLFQEVGCTLPASSFSVVFWSSVQIRSGKQHPAAEEPAVLETDSNYKKSYGSQMPSTLTEIDQVAGGITFHFALARGEARNDGKFSGGTFRKYLSVVALVVVVLCLSAANRKSGHSTPHSASTETEREEDGG